MLDNISVCDANTQEALQMLSAASKTLSAAIIVNRVHKARILPQDKCNSELGSESDAGMVNNWQHLCQKLDDEMALDDY
jgi:hypothetical protein